MSSTPSFVTQVQKPGNGQSKGKPNVPSSPTKPGAKSKPSSSTDEEVASCCFPFFSFCRRKRTPKKKLETKKGKTEDKKGGVDRTKRPSLSISNLDQRDEQGFNSPRVVVPRQTAKGGGGSDLLPPQASTRAGRKCLVLDLDETLVHSSFQPVDHYDFVLPVAIEDVTYTVYVAKRPGVDEFMLAMGEIYEIVIFTASLSQYADPVLDLLDVHNVIDFRLFREHCTFVKGSYVKDMGRMGRPRHSVMIMDNSPHSYAFNPENAIPCESWFDDQRDRELLDFIPILRELASCEDVVKELEKRNLNGFSALMALNANINDGTSEFYSTEYTTDSEWTETLTGSHTDSTSTGSISTRTTGTDQTEITSTENVSTRTTSVQSETASEDNESCSVSSRTTGSAKSSATSTERVSVRRPGRARNVKPSSTSSSTRTTDRSHTGSESCGSRSMGSSHSARSSSESGSVKCSRLRKKIPDGDQRTESGTTSSETNAKDLSHYSTRRTASGVSTKTTGSRKETTESSTHSTKSTGRRKGYTGRSTESGESSSGTQSSTTDITHSDSASSSSLSTKTTGSFSTRTTISANSTISGTKNTIIQTNTTQSASTTTTGDHKERRSTKCSECSTGTGASTTVESSEGSLT